MSENKEEMTILDDGEKIEASENEDKETEQAAGSNDKAKGEDSDKKESGSKRKPSSKREISRDKSAKEKKLEKRVKELEDEVGRLQEEKSELNNSYLRKHAEFENFRKRMLKDKEDAIRYANGGLLSDLLGILDDFERALLSSMESKDFDSFHSGVEMIEKQMVRMLERNWGLKRFDSEGEEFDPEKHEAIAMEDRDDHDSQVVLQDFQKGYMLHDRVLRHAKVKVANPV